MSMADTPARRHWIAVAALMLVGCSSLNFETSIQQVNQDLGALAQVPLQMPQTEGQRQALRLQAERYLAQPLGRDDAVRLALINSPAVQGLFAQAWQQSAQAAQTGRAFNPVLGFERAVMAGEIELARSLSVGLLDLLTLPQRQQLAQHGVQQAQLQLSAAVVDQVVLVRQAWVNAVAARQTVTYTQQVYEVAQASAELAKRMKAVGNFSKLQHLRQHAFYAEAATQLAAAQHAQTASTEALVRLLGLTDVQAGQLQLPLRLPDLPKHARGASEVVQDSRVQRLDIRLAQARLDAALASQGLTQIRSRIDIELSLGRDSVLDTASGDSTVRRHSEIGLRLPVFDDGDLLRQAMSAQTLAAMHQLESTVRTAASQLRENFSAYRIAYEQARHYRDQVLPVQQAIMDESVLRYNGMIIGVFELLAERRSQVASVLAAISAQRQFWQADAALQAAQLGRPLSIELNAPLLPAKAGSDAAH